MATWKVWTPSPWQWAKGSLLGPPATPEIAERFGIALAGTRHLVMSQAKLLGPDDVDGRLIEKAPTVAEILYDACEAVMENHDPEGDEIPDWFTEAVQELAEILGVEPVIGHPVFVWEAVKQRIEEAMAL